MCSLCFRFIFIPKILGRINKSPIQGQEKSTCTSRRMYKQIVFVPLKCNLSNESRKFVLDLAYHRLLGILVVLLSTQWVFPITFGMDLVVKEIG